MRPLRNLGRRKLRTALLPHLRLDLGLERDAIADRLQTMSGRLITRRRSASGGGDLEAVDPW